MKPNDVTREVIRAGLIVHSKLGPGLLENDGIKFDVGLRLDMVVEDSVVVEVKAVTRILPVHAAQLLSYLRLSDKPVGLLLNFHVRQLRQGIQRIVNRLDES